MGRHDKHGIFAGRGHFQQYWARDSFFASLGATKLKDFDVVKKQLELFVGFQGKQGNIPNQITPGLRASYRLIGGKVVDATALYIIAFADYIRESKDRNFAEKNFESARKAIEWLKRKDKNKDFLIEEGLFANWADSILKFGRVLYTNCCYYRALNDFARICRQVKREELALDYDKLAVNVKNAINEKFWLRDYYADWIDFRKHGNFASDGNALAVLWGVANKEQANRIERKIREFGLDALPLKTSHPGYPFWRIPIILLPFQAYHYHNGFSWLWLGCMNVIALHKIGLKDEAMVELERIAEAIVSNGTVHEIFWRGKPVKSLLIASEKPFAWSAALFIKAVKETQ